MKWNPYKDFVTVVGGNGSGKTVLIQRYLLANVKDKNTIYIINSSNESSWYNYAPEKNILKPLIYDLKWLETNLLRIISTAPGRVLLVVDDIDNWDIKASTILKSVVVNARHANVGLIVSTRQLSFIPKVLYAQSKYIFVANQQSDWDCYYLATIIGYARAETLKQLGDYEFARWGQKEKKLDYIKVKYGDNIEQQIGRSKAQEKKIRNDRRGSQEQHFRGIPINNQISEEID
jgi:hypothetical protein